MQVLNHRLKTRTGKRFQNGRVPQFHNWLVVFSCEDRKCEANPICEQRRAEPAADQQVHRRLRKRAAANERPKLGPVSKQQRVLNESLEGVGLAAGAEPAASDALPAATKQPNRAQYLQRAGALGFSGHILGRKRN